MSSGNLSNAADYDASGGCGCQVQNSCGCSYNGGSRIGKGKGKNCRAYSFVSKNPFDVGIAKQLGEDSDEYLVLLSGNHHSVSDYDHDNLPDWVAMGERPCRIYKTIGTDELVNIWSKKGSCWDDPCYTKKSFKNCHPNGYLNFYLTNGTNRSQVVEISDATVDTSQADPTLVLKVKVLHKGDERLELDGLYPRMFRVSLVIDHYSGLGLGKLGNGQPNTRNSAGQVVIAQAPPPVITADFSKTITGPTITGPTTTTTVTPTVTQSNQQALQQQMGEGGHKKHHKKKKNRPCKHLSGQKKKKCLKEHKQEKENGEGDDSGGDGEDTGGTDNERLLQRIRLQEAGLRKADVTLKRDHGKKKSLA